MASPLIESIQVVDDDYIDIKFETSLKRSSISNSRFNLIKPGTPSETILDPFHSIDVDKHYQSITKNLTLYFKSGVIQSNTDYRLEISGLQNAIGSVLPSAIHDFTSEEIIDDDYTPPEEPPVVIEDYSIKGHVFTSSSINEAINRDPEGFHIVSVEPSDGSAYLAPDTNDGIIEIEFSKRVSETYLTNQYFKTQRKKISRGINRWETLEAYFDQDDNEPIVYVSLPVNDDSEYFEPGYKYRVRVSRRVGSA